MRYLCAIFLLVLPAIALAKRGPIVIGGKGVREACSKALSDGSFRKDVGDPNNCGTFYKCSLWFQAKLSCKYGQHFSNKLQRCTDPCSAHCDPNIICTTTSAPVTTEGSGDDSDFKIFSEVRESKPVANKKKRSNDASGASVFLKDDSSEEDLPGTKKEDPSEEELTAYQKARLPKIEELVTETQPKSAVTTAAAPVAKTTVLPPASAGTGPEGPKAQSAVTAGTEDAITEASDTASIDATTPFWQAIVNFFNKPPASIPGFEGTIPPNSVNN